jgi:hypothetical protein
MKRKKKMKKKNPKFTKINRHGLHTNYRLKNGKELSEWSA